MDLYDTIGVPQDASQEDIKKAYRAKANKLHPDKNKDDPNAQSKFQELAQAYEVLKNPQKRLNYDKTGEAGGISDPEQEAIEIIAKMWIQEAERNCFEPDNYLDKVTSTLNKTLARCKSDADKLDDKASKLKELIDNTKADEVFMNIIDGKLRSINAEKAHALSAQEVMDIALKLLEGFEYTGPIPPKFESAVDYSYGSALKNTSSIFTTACP